MSIITVPRATYRIQFTPQFGFREALRIVPYLHKLGISHIYASPITRARRGSLHGYDVCDYATINPELGTLDDLTELLNAVARREMGWLQDIVPNHMAYSHENPYLVDVLEHGSASQYCDLFDITWNHQYESLRGRVLAPFLGKSYGQCVVDGELRIVLENGGLWVAYYDQRYPLSPDSYGAVLFDEADGLEGPTTDDPGNRDKFLAAMHVLDNLPAGGSPQLRSERCAAAKKTLRELFAADSGLRRHIERRINGFSTGMRETNIRFDKLMAKQHYRLAFWKVAAEELNYRRFFTVNDLIGVRIEREHVFDMTHSFILGFVEKGEINGLRIDHIDGLYDPSTYLKRLRARVPRAYIVVEKIVSKNEMIPPEWPVQGTTGYDFLNHANYVLCDGKSERRFDRIYERFIRRRIAPEELQLDKRRLIIGKHMAGDIDNLARLIIEVSDIDLMGRDITLYGLRRALVEVLAHFPVYRTYISATSYSGDDARCIFSTLSRSREAMPGLTVEFDFIERFLMMRGDTVLQQDFDETWKNAVMRFQQFTGPLMAKGFEDTLFYVFNRHVALNEVGGWPMHFGITASDFHTFLLTRKSTHPHAMNATATHDTKRGEDTRARLQVITELPGEWGKQVLSWMKLNTVHTTKKGSITWPDRNDEYLFYQTLAGTFPLDGTIDGGYVDRMREYMIKAVREAKVHTAWIKPDDEYERSVSAFTASCLDASISPLFIDAMRTFAQKISWFGLLNSLSQAILKCTAPGVPDFYQGTELLDFSLVDPDNRRPVDYSMREALLAKAADVRDVVGAMIDGRLKLFAVSTCLAARRGQRRIFESGDYLSLDAEGLHRRSILAFARRYAGGCLLVLVPRFTCRLVTVSQLPLGRAVWQDTRLRIPRSMWGRSMTDIFTGESLTVGREIIVGDVLKSFPAAMLTDAHSHSSR
ncbi:MAG: malto-oligosyltrehalose synthase [Chitinispirillaceae bacterium]|nr:malto-oligosyltrehalose synthase [Chitinispirillaceae bacterium]